MLFIFIQCGYIPLIVLDQYFQEESRLDNDVVEIVLVVIALIFISVSWWENFVDDNFCGRTSQRNGWHQFILRVKFDLQESRPVASFFMSMWKIALTILFSWTFKDFLFINKDEDVKNIDGITMTQIYDYWSQQSLKDNSSILILTLTSFVGYYVAYTACKLKLQKFSFNIPLLLSVPVSVILVSLNCTVDDLDLFKPFTNEKDACRYMEGEEIHQNKWYHFVCGAAAWISLYGIARHIFFPKIERLAKAER